MHTPYVRIFDSQQPRARARPTKPQPTPFAQRRDVKEKKSSVTYVRCMWKFRCRIARARARALVCVRIEHRFQHTIGAVALGCVCCIIDSSSSSVAVAAAASSCATRCYSYPARAQTPACMYMCAIYIHWHFCPISRALARSAVLRKVDNQSNLYSLEHL